MLSSVIHPVLQSSDIPVELPSSDLPPELQVQRAVQAVDNSITIAQKERDLAMQRAEYEKAKRLEAEAEVKRLQESRNVVGVGKRIEAMLSATKAVELDDMLAELDKDFGENLNFEYTDDNTDHEKISKLGHQYIDRVSKALEPLGDLSRLSDADFINTRYSYIMDDQ